MNKVIVLLFAGTVALALPEVRYVSSIQWVIRENSSPMIQRSQNLVVETMRNGFQNSPVLQHRPFEVKTNGENVVLYLTTQEDIRPQFQEFVEQTVQRLNGKVLAGGNVRFYRTDPNVAREGYVEVLLNEDHSLLRSVMAESVPLREVLKGIKSQFPQVSYLVPGECAEKNVDWNFKSPSPSPGLSVDQVVKKLASHFQLNVERRENTYVFLGHCENTRGANVPLALPSNPFQPRPVMFEASSDFGR